MRKYGRTDANHQAVKEALEAIGASVQSLADIGNGCPDLLVGYKGRTILLEVKDGSKPPSKRGLTLDQLVWHSKWKGQRMYIVLSPEEAVRRVELLTGGAL